MIAIESLKDRMGAREISARNDWRACVQKMVGGGELTAKEFDKLESAGAVLDRGMDEFEEDIATWKDVSERRKRTANADQVIREAEAASKAAADRIAHIQTTELPKLRETQANEHWRGRTMHLEVSELSNLVRTHPHLFDEGTTPPKE